MYYTVVLNAGEDSYGAEDVIQHLRGQNILAHKRQVVHRNVNGPFWAVTMIVSSAELLMIKLYYGEPLFCTPYNKRKQ